MAIRYSAFIKCDGCEKRIHTGGVWEDVTDEKIADLYSDAKLAGWVAEVGLHLCPPCSRKAVRLRNKRK